MRDSISLKYNDFEVEKGSLRKCENGIEVTLEQCGKRNCRGGLI